jgi:hypothetical protein
MKISTLIAFFSKKRKMKEDIENKNRIEVKGDDKVVLENSTDHAVNDIEVEGNNNVVIQNSGSSNITIVKDGKKIVF